MNQRFAGVLDLVIASFALAALAPCAVFRAGHLRPLSATGLDHGWSLWQRGPRHPAR
jgi:hypothetical protein